MIPTPAAVAAQTAPPVSAGTASVPYTDITELLATMRRTAEQELDRDSAGLGRPIETSVVEGVAARAIVEHADANSVDLIVMSTRGEGGLMRLVLGSVTDEVIRSSSRPVMVIPAAD